MFMHADAAAAAEMAHNKIDILVLFAHTGRNLARHRFGIQRMTCCNTLNARQAGNFCNRLHFVHHDDIIIISRNTKVLDPFISNHRSKAHRMHGIHRSEALINHVLINLVCAAVIFPASRTSARGDDVNIGRLQLVLVKIIIDCRFPHRKLADDIRVLADFRSRMLKVGLIELPLIFKKRQFRRRRAGVDTKDLVYFFVFVHFHIPFFIMVLLFALSYATEEHIPCPQCRIVSSGKTNIFSAMTCAASCGSAPGRSIRPVVPRRMVSPQNR